MKKSTYAFTLGLFLGCVAGAIGYYLFQKPKYKKQILKIFSWFESRLNSPSVVKKSSKVQKPKLKKFIRKGT